MCDSFIFYRSFYESAKLLDEETRLSLYDALMEYGLNGIELPISGVAKALFTVVKPQIDANAKRRANGNLGGRPKKEPMVSNENNHRFSDSETIGYEIEKPNVNDNVNVNVNENANVNVNENENDLKKEDAIASKKETVAALLGRWNGYKDRGSIPAVRSVTKDSKVWKSIFARIDDVGIDAVNEVMDMVFESDYLRGMKTSWCAKFDWMFLPSNFDKIRNGNYRNLKQSPQDFGSSQERGGYEAMMELRRRADAERSAV